MLRCFFLKTALAQGRAMIDAPAQAFCCSKLFLYPGCHTTVLLSYRRGLSSLGECQYITSSEKSRL